MEGAEPLPRRSLSVLPKLPTVLPLITKCAQHQKILKKDFFDKLSSPCLVPTRQGELLRIMESNLRKCPRNRRQNLLFPADDTGEDGGVPFQLAAGEGGAEAPLGVLAVIDHVGGLVPDAGQHIKDVRQPLAAYCLGEVGEEELLGGIQVSACSYSSPGRCHSGCPPP